MTKRRSDGGAEKRRDVGAFGGTVGGGGRAAIAICMLTHAVAGARLTYVSAVTSQCGSLYPWKRFWCPRGETIHLLNDYLLDPSTKPG